MADDDARSLEIQLDELSLVLDEQIKVITIEAEKVGLNPLQMRTSKGGWPMIPLLAAKAQTLHSLVLLREGRSGQVFNIYASPEES